MITDAILQQVTAFAGFDERALRAVGALMRVYMVADGHHILRQGSRAGGMFVLLDGEVRAVRQLSQGRTVDVRTIEKGTLFGLLSCLDSAPRGSTYVARGRVQVAELPRDAVTELLQGRTGVALSFQLAVCRTLFQEVRVTNHRLAELSAIPDSEVETADLTLQLAQEELESADIEPLEDSDSDDEILA